MTAAFNLNAIAQASTVQIVNCLVEGTLVAIFTGSLLSVMRRQSSVTRFAVWFSTLMAIATLPFFVGSFGSHVASNPLAVAVRPALTLPGTWALYLFGAWIAIASWHLAGVARGLWHLYTLRKSCVAIDPTTLDSLLQNTLARNQSPRKIALCTSDLTNVPTALGLLKPAIVIPAWVMQELSPEELNQILLHEIAHLRRWDDWTNLAQKLVKALFFFHPAVWWIEKKVSLEREMACDDAVLAETASPRAYAECLAHLAEKTLIQRSIAFAQAALGKIHQTSLRVAQILDADRPTGNGRSWKPAVSLVGAFALVCVLGIARAPRLIAFNDSQASHAAAPAMADSSVDPWRGSLSTSMPIVNVSAKLTPQCRPRLTHAKLTTLATHRKSGVPAATPAVQSAPAEQRAASLVHLTSANAAQLAFTETLFVVVEGSQSDPAAQPVFQIQMWRVVVLHPVVDPDSNRIPAKRT
jgi:beta-lactamase regulating signal transducer with metallopeptidase domain